MINHQKNSSQKTIVKNELMVNKLFNDGTFPIIIKLNIPIQSKLLNLLD